MCSFLFTNKEIDDLNSVNFLIQKRGPDFTIKTIIDNFTYIHNLLSITGEFTTQPIIGENINLLFNGEIYNYKDFGNYKSDGHCILDVYEKMGLEGLVNLDGEFSICIVDKKKDLIILVTDTFGTKPLYFSIQDNDIGVSSYPTPLEHLKFIDIKRAKPNNILIIDIKNFLIREERPLYEFDLSQNVNYYDKWVESFYESIKKRVNTDLDILVPLSSGYDSGLICATLNSINRDYISCTVMGLENRDVLNERIKINKNTKKEIIESINPETINEIKKFFNENVQKFSYGPNPENFTHNGFDDVGAIGLFFILKEMKNKYGIKILLSGQGSDEIMSNIPTYGFRTSNPKKFGEDLKSIFPWGNFYYGSQWSYLMKEECIAGSLGIETRYPFLDRKVVQNFLNLNPNLKNEHYKSPINHMFSILNYPFNEQKIGFQIG